MRRGLVDGRVGELGIRVTANRATTFVFTFTSDEPLSFTSASLWLGGSGVGGDLTGATEHPMAVIGVVGTIVIPAFTDELYFPLRLTLDGVVVSIGGLWVDPDGSYDPTRNVTVALGTVRVTINVLGGILGAIEVRENEQWPAANEIDGVVYLHTEG